MRYL
jgi:hypothetical protein